MSEETYQQGYDEGYADGYAGRPIDVAPRIMDFLNTKDVQDYEDGYREGYANGEENRRRHEG